MVAGYILYTDYGFWHERYIREESSLTTKDISMLSESAPASPLRTFGRFLGEAKEQLQTMKVDTSFLEGKEVYEK